MERVVTINLNGNPYQLEEPAFDALRSYLERAGGALSDNPDKAEIIRDLEQAVADKCASYLGPSKTVITAAEMTRILEEMGPVEGEASAEQPRAQSSSSSSGEHPRRRLYRVKDRAVISGVCSGIGAYFDIDPNIIRLLFVLTAVFTQGLGLIVYIVLMFAIPSAHTSEEWAAAHGVAFNAQEVIDRAKREYARFADGEGQSWRAQMRVQRRAWRNNMRSWRTNWDWGYAPSAPPPQPVGYVTRVFAGIAAFIFSIVTAAFFIAFLIAFFSLLQTGAVLGWTPPGDLPMWLVLVILCITYAAISAPFSALRRSSYAAVSGYRYGWRGGGADGAVTLLIILVAGWFAWNYIPDARELMQAAPAALEHLFDNLATNYF